MAKPITATPMVSGEDARKIIQELEQGTPMTDARRELLAASERNFAQHRHVFAREGIKSER